jgi:hypothetical protein
MSKPVIPPYVKKKYDIPVIAPEDMTPQAAVLLASIAESLRLRDLAIAEGVALRKELAQLQRAKKRKTRSSK